MIVKFIAGVLLLALVAAAGFALLLVNGAQGAEEYRQCYQQSMHEHDYRFAACRQVTQEIKRDYHLGAP